MRAIDTSVVSNSEQINVHNPATLVDLLHSRAIDYSGLKAFAFLDDEGRAEAEITYSQLDRRAKTIAAFLQSSMAEGERALLLYSVGPEFMAAFFGCIYAGVIPIPLPLPDPARLNRALPRLRAIITDAQPSVALTTSAGISVIEGQSARIPELSMPRWLTAERAMGDRADEWRRPSINGDTLATILYTSGPIRTPKGVMMSHENLLSNMANFSERCGLMRDDVLVSWLPHYTAFGMIFGVLQHLQAGALSCLMSPVSFIKGPFRWLQAISNHRATHTAAPNFAYDLCVRETSPAQGSALDLSSLRVAGNGAEMIRKATLERFATAFAPCGFRPSAFCPIYGLSEAMVVSSGQVEDAPVYAALNAASLENRRISESLQPAGDVKTVVACGQPLAQTSIAILDPHSLSECGPDEIGEILVSSPSIAQGYWNQPEETLRSLKVSLPESGQGPFLRTGDLGFIRDGELFITGRSKDLIIVRGQNHYPRDIELTIQDNCPYLSADRCAAFSIDLDSEELPVIVAELNASHYEPADTEGRDELIEHIRQVITDYHGLQVYSVVLVKAGSLPMNDRGAVDRSACRKEFLASRLDTIEKWVRPTTDGAYAGSRSGVTRQAILSADSQDRQKLAELYLLGQIADLLRVSASKVDAEKSPIQLGIDSLLILDLKNRIEIETGAVLSVSDFLEASSIASLSARMLDGLTASSPALSEQFRSKHDSAGLHPLSYNQRSLWFMHQLAPESAAYNVMFCVRILSALDIEALQRAFQRILDRHSSLRTTYVAANGQVFQQVREKQEISLSRYDAEGWSGEELNERLIKDRDTPFDLEHGPLMRVSLRTVSEEEHVLLLTLHHIAIDFWSLEIIVAELGIFYSAEKNGQPINLPPVEVRYSDYARWQSEMLAGPEGERLWAYWREQLAGELPVLKFPTDRPRPPVQTFRGTSYAFVIDEELTSQIKALAHRDDATLYMALVASLFLLLHRYCGQQEILMGSAAAGRTRAGLESVLGYFVNPLVLRANLAGKLGFRSLLAQVRRIVVEALRYQDFPFTRLVELLQPDLDASRSPLFQVMFVLEKPFRPEDEQMARFALGEPGARMNLGGLELESFALENRVAQFDLTLMMSETGGRIFASLPYNKDLFDAATIARMADHFKNLLKAVVTDPEASLHDLTLLSETERFQLLQEWNDTRIDEPQSQCIHELFEAQALRSPGAVAVICDGERMTYRELNSRANKLAHKLRAMGVGPESVVGISSKRSTDMIVGVLAILKSGGAYVPLDVAYPEERIAYILKDTGTALLLTQEELAPRFIGSARLLRLDSDWDEIAKESAENPSGNVVGSNLAYVIYTSGSTGNPKGVMVEHQSVANFAQAHQHAIYSNHPKAGLHATLNAPLAFDACVERILLLLYGHTLHILTDEVRQDPDALIAYATRHRLNVLDLTPSQLRPLIDGGLLDALKGDPLLVLVGGEAIDEYLWQVLAKNSNVEFYNVYGPTECTVNASVCRIKDAQEKPTIGTPLGNVQIYLLDAHYNPVPVGVHGEIYVGGKGVARGYLNRPDLTAERFVPNPFGPEAGSRLYKTSDLAKYLPDGRIEFLGRADNQVKIRGFRIELGEIESVLAQHEAITEALVIAREDRPGDKYLVAYIVPENSAATSPEKVKNYLKERLPQYMIPRAFVILEAIPLTPNGKIDRNALPAPDGKSVIEGSYLAPRTGIESALVGLWSEVLQIEPVGIHDDFFESGGHSLSASRLMLRIRELFDVKLPLRTIFDSPTPAALAVEVLQKQMEEEDGHKIEQILLELDTLSEDQVKRLLDDEL